MDELEMNVITCEHKQGVGKDSGKPYDFFTGTVYLLGGVVQYSSSKAFTPHISETITAKVKLVDAGNGAVKVKLEPSL